MTEEIKAFFVPSFRELKEMGKKILYLDVEDLHSLIDTDYDKFVQKLCSMMEDALAVFLVTNLKEDSARVELLNNFLLYFKKDVVRRIDFLKDSERLMRGVYEKKN